MDGFSPNLIFFTIVLSIGAGLVKKSRGTFHFHKLDVYVKGSTKVFNFFLLKSSKTKRIAPTRLHFPRHLILDPAGQVQAAAIISSDSLINVTIIL